MRKADCLALGRRIQKKAASNEAFALLDEEDLDSFQTGGCALLAAAVESAYGLPQATVSSDRNNAEHIVNACEDGFIDSDGWQTKEQLFEKLAMEASSPRRFRVRQGLVEHDFVCPAYLVEELAHLLRAPRKNPALRWFHGTNDSSGLSVGDFLDPNYANFEPVSWVTSSAKAAWAYAQDSTVPLQAAGEKSTPLVYEIEIDPKASIEMVEDYNDISEDDFAEIAKDEGYDAIFIEEGEQGVPVMAILYSGVARLVKEVRKNPARTMIVYHGGSLWKNKTPSLDYVGRGEGGDIGSLLGPGVYFTDDEDYARSYLKYGGSRPTLYKCSIETTGLLSTNGDTPQLTKRVQNLLNSLVEEYNAEALVKRNSLGNISNVEGHDPGRRDGNSVCGLVFALVIAKRSPPWPQFLSDKEIKQALAYGRSLLSEIGVYGVRQTIGAGTPDEFTEIAVFDLSIIKVLEEITFFNEEEAALNDSWRLFEEYLDNVWLDFEGVDLSNLGAIEERYSDWPDYLKRLEKHPGRPKKYQGQALSNEELEEMLNFYYADSAAAKASWQKNLYRKNPARARRSGERKIEKYVEEYGDVWIDVDYERFTQAPFLTEGHFDLPMVKEAVRIASRAKESESLGRGQYGEAFIVETRKGPVVVKIAAERMLHQDQRPWTREEQIVNIMHEAGVANELEEMGYGFIPRSVYVELEDGTPAIVREYGEPVEPGELSGREFYELEKALFGLEQDTGWRIQDELLLLRRPDGSLFIGDVGIWDAPNVGREREWRLADSHLPSLVGNLGEHLFGQRFSSLGRVQQLKKQIKEKDLEDAFSKYFQKELTKAIASRRALRIPSES